MHHAIKSQLLAAKLRVNARPRLKATPTVVYLERSTAEINQTIFPLQDRHKGCLCIVLLLRNDGSRFKPLKRFGHQVCAHGSKQRGDIFTCLVRSNRQLPLQQNIARVQSLINAHCRCAGHWLAVGDRPLNRRRTAIFWQQRSVQIQVAVLRQVKHPLWNDASIGNYDDGFRLNGLQLPLQFSICPDLFRLYDWKSGLNRSLLDGRGYQVHPAALRTVRLRYNKANVVPCIVEQFESRNSELRCSAEDKLHLVSGTRR